MPMPWRKQKSNNKSLQQPNSFVDLILKKRADVAKKPSKKKRECKQSTVMMKESETDQTSVDAVNASTDEVKPDNNEVCDSYGNDNFSRHDCSSDDEDEEEGGTNDGILGSNKAMCLLVLKGSLVVGVAFLTKRFTIGIILGSFLLLLFEYFGDSIIQYCGPCEPLVRRIHGFAYTCNDSNECKEYVEANNGLKDVKECDSDMVSDKENKDEGANNLVLSLPKGIVDQDSGNLVGMNGGTEHENVHKFVVKDSKQIDDETWDKIVTSIESIDETWDKIVTSIEPIDLNGAQQSSCNAPGGLCEPQGTTLPISRSEEEEEALKMGNQDHKPKKGKKFWKKFSIIHKKIKNKNNRDEQPESDGCEMNNDSTEKFEPDSGDDDDNDNDNDDDDDDDNDDDGGGGGGDGDEPGNFDSLLEDSRIRNHKFTCDDCVQIIGHDWLTLQGTNSKFLIMVSVVLGGLTQGRMFAIILTVISCFVMKMVKI